MKTQEEIIARLGHSVVALASLCIVLAVVIVLMLNKKYTTDVEIAVNNITSDSPVPTPNSQSNYTPGPDGIDGSKLFRQNCAVCHSLTDAIITGPGLGGVMNRVPSEEWVHKWIKDPDGMKRSGDPYASKIDKENTNNMTPFAAFSDAEINAIIDFLKTK